MYNVTVYTDLYTGTEIRADSVHMDVHVPCVGTVQMKVYLVFCIIV